jgi:hypothetical protein
MRLGKLAMQVLFIGQNTFALKPKVLAKTKPVKRLLWRFPNPPSQMMLIVLVKPVSLPFGTKS